ncbi:MAG TPA: hypothetical protein VFY51_10925 [Pyrinomonadaceae bacterium]|nr:hypothetical protein [Pyrinomonadaceae bacterium]
MKIVLLNIALFVLVVIFSLPFLALFLTLILFIGGGWAYAGPAGCHFVINPIGYAMLSVPLLAVLGAARIGLHKLLRQT